MSWLSRLFGLTRSSDGVLDLRPLSEQQMAERAKRPLKNKKDEQFAHRMVVLLSEAQRLYDVDLRAQKEKLAEIRKIGEQLCANGGSDRMVQVAHRVQALGGSIRDCEWRWKGICGWRS